MFSPNNLLKLLSLTEKGIFGGEWIDIYVWLNPFTLHLKVSQHCLLTGYTPTQNKKLKIKSKSKTKHYSRLYSLHHSPTIHDITPTEYDITYTLLVTSQPCNYKKTPTIFLILLSVYNISHGE